MFTISNLAKRGGNYLLMVFFARSFSVDLFGTFSAYVNVISVIVLLTNFGFSEYLLVNSEDKKILNKNVSHFLLTSIALLLFLSLLSLVLPIENKLLALLVIFKIFFETSLYNILLAYYQVSKSIKWGTLINILSGISVVALGYINYEFNHSIYFYLISINVAYVLIFISFILFIKIEIKGPHSLLLFLKKKFNVLRYYGVSMVTVPIYMMAPTVIGSVLLKPESLAQYQVAFSISNILLLVSVSLLQVGYVKFIEVKDNMSELKMVLKNFGIKILGINLSFLLFFAFFGKELLIAIYGKGDYIEAYFPLLILLMANIIFMFAAIMAVVMIVRKEQKEKSKYHIEFIIISILCGFLFTYFFEIYGIVFSYLALYTYSAIRYSLRFYNIHRSNYVL